MSFSAFPTPSGLLILKVYLLKAWLNPMSVSLALRDPDSLPDRQDRHLQHCRRGTELWRCMKRFCPQLKALELFLAPLAILTLDELALLDLRGSSGKAGMLGDEN